MRSRWFHRPVLHTARHHEKKVTWLELFYDLIFVAAIIQLGDALSEDISLGNFAAFAGHFVPLWIAWTGFTFYANRFTVDDFTHRILVFIKMMAVGAMAIAAPDAMDGRHAPFAVYFGIAQVLLALLNLRAWKQVKEARDYSRYWGSVFGIGALVWFISAAVPNPWCYILWGLGMAVIFFAPISKSSRELMERLPVDFEHLGERYGLLTIIVLGESFVKVLSHLTRGGHSSDPEYLLKGGFVLVLTCCVWWIYFDDVAGSKIKEGRGTWIVWLYGHMPLAIAATGVGVAIKKAVTFEMSAPAEYGYLWLLAGTLAMVLFSVALIDSVTERRQAQLSDRARVNVRLASGFIVLIAGQVGTTMNAGTFLALMTAVCVGQVIFDMMMAPFEEAHLEGAKSIAEMHQEVTRGERDARSTRPRGPFDVIRKGAPPELRRDLYFFFLEGSWTRLIGSMLFVYVIINVFFAGLYLIEPGSISGTGSESFADAFFFSVQTMSTIGYGGLAPASDYGDMIVTFEAAIGLLGVAVATGLIFAKVSRPQAGVLFSRPMILTTRHGKRTLEFRVGNARGNEVVDATMSVSVLKEEISPEGHHLRRLHDLKLMRSRTPIFTMSWSVIHEVDEESPLWDVDWDNPAEQIMLFITTLMGHDGTYGQTTYARHLYYADDVRVDHRFVDVLSQLEDGRMVVDYTKFHDTHHDDEAQAA